MADEQNIATPPPQSQPPASPPPASPASPPPASTGEAPPAAPADSAPTGAEGSTPPNGAQPDAPQPPQQGEGQQKPDYYGIAKQWVSDNITEAVAVDAANNLILIIHTVFYSPVDILIELFDLIIRSSRRFTLFVFWLIFILIMNIFNITMYFVLGEYDIIPYIVGSGLSTLMFLFFLMKTVKRPTQNTQALSSDSVEESVHIASDEITEEDSSTVSTPDAQQPSTVESENNNGVTVLNWGDEFDDEEEL